jgi:hypothetical protein
VPPTAFGQPETELERLFPGGQFAFGVTRPSAVSSRHRSAAVSPRGPRLARSARREIPRVAASRWLHTPSRHSHEGPVLQTHCASLTSAAVKVCCGAAVLGRLNAAAMTTATPRMANLCMPPAFIWIPNRRPAAHCAIGSSSYVRLHGECYQRDVSADKDRDPLRQVVQHLLASVGALGAFTDTVVEGSEVRRQAFRRRQVNDASTRTTPRRRSSLGR